MKAKAEELTVKTNVHWAALLDRLDQDTVPKGHMARMNLLVTILRNTLPGNLVVGFDAHDGMLVLHSTAGAHGWFDIIQALERLGDML